MNTIKPPKSPKNNVIDERDRIILSALVKDGRASFKELGAKIALSPNAAAERVNRLLAAGVIRGFSATVDPGALGFGLQAFIDVKLQQGVSMETFEKALRKVPGVREATVLTGGFDARVRADCVDPTHLAHLIEELRTKAGVQETSSTVICRSLRL
jgi:Lrp/AsnC family transcriptional regulator, leucine-responsive regulatory protein